MIKEYNANSVIKFDSRNSARDVSAIIKSSEQQFLTYIIQMFDVLNKDEIDLRKFGDVIDALMHLKNEQEKDYLNSLVRPEKSKGCKIPNRIPIPSASFQLKHSINVSSNSLGNVAISLNPVMMGDVFTSTGGTFFINNDPSLTGSASSNFFISTDIGQGIPPVYTSYRLVSASIVAKYIGRAEAVQGVIGGGILFDYSIGTSVYGFTNAALAKYGDFNIVQDAYFQQENHLADGIRIIYFPLDPSFETYSRLNTLRLGFNKFIYVRGGPPSSVILKLDVFLNFECLPEASFLNYIPTSSSMPYAGNRDEVVKIAQKQAITSEVQLHSNDDEKKPVGKSTFDSVVETLGTVIPSIIDIAKIVALFI